jgi:hypothetical protein
LYARGVRRSEEQYDSIKSSESNHMKRTRLLARGLVLTVIAVWSVSQANATVSYKVSDGGLEYDTITLAGYNGGSAFSALAGGIAIQRVGGDTGVPNNYVTICTDVGGTLYLGWTYTYDKPVPFSGQTGINPNWGADNGFGGTPNEASAQKAIQNAAELFYTHFDVLTTGTTSQKAALQLAVWDAIYDTDATGQLTGNRFSFSGNSAALAQTWLDALTHTTSYTGGLLYPDPLNQGNPNGEPPQELLMRTQDFTPVPEPTTVIAGALLLLPFGASTLRILRRKQ